ncbi:hypothetical protein [Rheinheimera sp. F8]|uniref:hypothetical protein n=1 Tax=Rheinheimera sp. F8 TaxID=1763998 RepID=UPI000744CEDD|nr:hypothetical protein [Rheinheimera sp. F8]ALZ74596.1 hypothetical protein ATY27_01685 [Rheinheimera sp. F8]
MQPDKPAQPNIAVALQTVASGQDLLQQALALFELQHIQPVAMAFPDVISAGGVALTLPDPARLFAEQEQLFAGVDSTESESDPGSVSGMSAEPAPAADASADSAELQAIRQMYAAD